MYEQARGMGDAAIQMQIHQQTTAYNRAQSAMGSPVAETLQVDESMASLGNAVEFLTETVQALLRRIEPVTGEVLASGQIGGGTVVPMRAPLAEQIDRQYERVSALAKEVQTAIRALQI